MEFLALFAAGLGGVVIHLCASELWCHCPGIAKWLIARAVEQLPAEDRARYAEEWLAHANECTGNLSKIRHALECFISARAIRAIGRSRLKFAFQLETDDEKEWTIGIGEETLKVDVATLRLIMVSLQSLKTGLNDEGVKVEIDGFKEVLSLIGEHLENNDQPDRIQFERFINYLSSTIAEAIEIRNQ
jgi:hypothetical protein